MLSFPVLVAFVRGRRSNRECLEDGSQHLKLLDAIKKEFRVSWVFCNLLFLRTGIARYIATTFLTATVCVAIVYVLPQYLFLWHQTDTVFVPTASVLSVCLYVYSHSIRTCSTGTVAVCVCCWTPEECKVLLVTYIILKFSIQNEFKFGKI
jgi:hypothetical protein